MIHGSTMKNYFWSIPEVTVGKTYYQGFDTLCEVKAAAAPYLEGIDRRL